MLPGGPRVAYFTLIIETVWSRDFAIRPRGVLAAGRLVARETVLENAELREEMIELRLKGPKALPCQIKFFADAFQFRFKAADAMFEFDGFRSCTFVGGRRQLGSAGVPPCAHGSRV